MAKKIEPPFVRNPYNYDTVEAGNDSAIACKDEHRTQQQFAEESDINFIADKFGLNDSPIPDGILYIEGQPAPEFADYDGVFDFQTANNQVIAGTRAFMALPAKLRARFSHDPGEYLAFMQDHHNLDEAVKLGLATRRQEPPQSPPGDAKADTKGAPPAPKGEAPASPAKPPKTET